MDSCEKETEIFERKTILGIIIKLEDEIRANGLPQEECARRWAHLGHFYGRIGDRLQQRFALKQALSINPKNTWAKNQLAGMMS